MIYFIVVVVLIAITLLLLEVRAQYSLRGTGSPGLEELDMPAFLNLVDPAQLAAVQKRLTAAEFRWYRKQRSRVMLQYTKAIAHNCAVVIHQITASRSELSAEQRKLLNLAVRTRLYSIVTIAALQISIWIPMADGLVGNLASRYRSISDLHGDNAAAVAR